MIIGAETLAVACGLGSAIAWGAGDFSGGYATRRTNVFSVILLSQMVGTLLIALLTVWFAQLFPGGRYIIMSCLAGVFGAVGLITLYKALSIGRMGVVAPIAAVTSALLPIIFAFFVEGLPKTTQMLGFGLAIVAVWLMSTTDKTTHVAFGELGLPILAGLCFGLFFILIDGAIKQDLMWSLLFVRLAAFPLLLVLFLIRREKGLPGGRQLLLILLAGVFDAGGNAFFGLAAQFGRLDIAAVICSLYPAVTAMLAWLILKEQLRRRQWAGVAMALSALLLISL